MKTGNFFCSKCLASVKSVANHLWIIVFVQKSGFFDHFDTAFYRLI